MASHGVVVMSTTLALIALGARVGGCVSNFQKGLGRSRASSDAPTESDWKNLDLRERRLSLQSMERMPERDVLSISSA